MSKDMTASRELRFPVQLLLAELPIFFILGGPQQARMKNRIPLGTVRVRMEQPNL
jgi:hypothetical protein